MSRTVTERDFNDPTTLKRVEKLARYLNQEQIADVLGIHDRTLRKRFAENPKLRAAYQKGKSYAVRDVAQSLVQGARKGNIIAQIFYLKTQGRWREKDKPGESVSDEEMIQRVREGLDAMDDATHG